MVTGAANRPPEWTSLSIRDLEVGDWRRAFILPAGPIVDHDRLQPAHLVVIMRTTADAMRSQATGDIDGAASRYGTASAMLPAVIARMSRNGQRHAMVARPATTEDPIRANGYWKVACVIWREQLLIEELFTQLNSGSRARDYLIEAYIHFMFELEFLPFACYRPTKEVPAPYPETLPSRDDLCRRATRLRNAAQPKGADVSKSVWDDLGGYRGLRAAALTRLADRPLTPWGGDDPSSEGMPVRLGRLRAWQHARTWRHDVGA